jgi:hypothetical protein
MEASSLRVELEGLITAYELLPSDLYIIHYMDNTQPLPSTTASRSTVFLPHAN